MRINADGTDIRGFLLLFGYIAGRIEHFHEGKEFYPVEKERT
jgi:hypothetical protein